MDTIVTALTGALLDIVTTSYYECGGGIVSTRCWANSMSYKAYFHSRSMGLSDAIATTANKVAVQIVHLYLSVVSDVATLVCCPSSMILGLDKRSTLRKCSGSLCYTSSHCW
jgi:hypothetical protein